jgi:hypothetical protein
MKVDALTSLPALGAFWPEQGGHFAGITQDSASAMFAVIVAARSGNEFASVEWGGYGKDAPGATHWTDGLSNTTALEAAKTDHPAAELCMSFEHEGHSDWYLPSIGELQLAHMHCRTQFESDGWYWSSTQYGRGHAWVQDFETGISYDSIKDSQRRVRPFRRFLL